MMTMIMMLSQIYIWYMYRCWRWTFFCMQQILWHVCCMIVKTVNMTQLLSVHYIRINRSIVVTINPKYVINFVLQDQKHKESYINLCFFESTTLALVWSLAHQDASFINGKQTKPNHCYLFSTDCFDLFSSPKKFQFQFIK